MYVFVIDSSRAGMYGLIIDGISLHYESSFAVKKIVQGDKILYNGVKFLSLRT